MKLNIDELHVQRLKPTNVLEKTSIKSMIFFVLKICLKNVSKARFKRSFHFRGVKGRADFIIPIW